VHEGVEPAIEARRAKAAASLSGKFARLGFDRPLGLVLWTIAVSTAIRFAMAWAAVDVGNSEAYYIATARHLALSTFDHPPLSFWMTWATMKATGSDWLPVVRAPFILMFIGTTWLMYRLGAELFGAPAGAFAALLLNVSPVFAISIGAWVQPDGPLIFFLLATTLCVARLAFAPAVRNRTGHWALAGVWFGLALLSKYYAVLLPVGIFLFALTSREHRRWFAEPGPYLAAAIGLAMFTPVLVWNSQHGWISLGFQGGRVVETEGIQIRWFFDNIFGTAALVGPWIWVPQLQAAIVAVKNGPREAEPWFFAVLGGTTIAVFTVIGLWVSVGGRFHWQAPGFLLLFPLLGRLVVQKLGRDDAMTRRWLLASTAIMVLFVAVVGTHAATGWIRTLVPPRGDGRTGDPTLKGLTFDGVRAAVAARGLLDKPRLFVVSADRNDVGKVDLELGKFLPVLCLCADPRNMAFGWNPDDFIGQDALIVGAEGYVGDAQNIYGSYFRKIEFLADVDMRRGGKVWEKIKIFYATDYYRPYPLPLREAGR
jgi:hypothetical protein